MKKKDLDFLESLYPGMNAGNAFWGFTCFSRQSYAETVPLDCVDQIVLGIQCRDGGCYCEMAIRWHNLGRQTALRIECFDDAWAVLQTPTFAEVLRKLMAEEKENLFPEKVSRLLISCGFIDMSDTPLADTGNRAKGGGMW